jgi:heme-degrading monooxygenase HmoA
MFTHMAIHRPKPEYIEDVLASMNRVNAAAAGAHGLLAMNAWREIDGDRVVAFATWQSKESWQAAASEIFAVVANDPFDLWEQGQIEVMYLEAD